MVAVAGWQLCDQAFSPEQNRGVAKGGGRRRCRSRWTLKSAETLAVIETEVCVTRLAAATKQDVLYGAEVDWR